MPDIVDKIHAFGGLDKDSDVPYVKESDYVDALNIRHVSQDGGTGRSIQNVLGNKLISNYNGGYISSQSKLFRIYADANQSHTYRFDILDQNNNTLVITNPIINTVGDIALTLTDIRGELDNAVAILGPNYVGAQVSIDYSIITQTGYLEYFYDYNTGGPVGWDYTIQNNLSGYPTEIIIAKEAIDPGLAGYYHPIGSYDLNGDLFIFSTTQVNMPQSITFSSIYQNPSTLEAVIVLDSPINIPPFSTVTISGTGAGLINGVWTIYQLSTTDICLYGSLFFSNDEGTCSIYQKGYGEIGVIYETPGLGPNGSSSYSYVRLLGSTEMNFRIDKMIDCKFEKDIYRIEGLFTDDYNQPRTFYYYNDYQTDGALNYIDSNNIYFYGTISEQLKLIPSASSLKVDFVNQLEGGGGINAGNHRYAVRLLTESFSETAWSELTNPVIVYNAAISNPYKIGGDDGFTQTGKQNVLLVSGIPPNTFKYLELCDLYYVDNTVKATIVDRYLLTQQPTQQITHTGREVTVSDIDAATINSLKAEIKQAKNLDIIDNRLVLSNTVAYDEPDFTEFAQTFQHILGKQSFLSVGEPITGRYRTAEYADPVNVYSKTGYMLNETYRFGVKFILKNGHITSTYWVDDIRFDCEPNNNIANKTSNRRLSGLPNYDLTDYGGVGSINLSVYIPLLQFVFDIDYTLSNGTIVKDIVQEVVFERVEMIDQYREIVASGVSVPFNKKTTKDPFQSYLTAGYGYFKNETNVYYDNPSPNDYLGEFQYITGIGPTPTQPTVDIPYSGGGYPSLGPADQERKYISFYSPDIYYNYVGYSFLTNDEIINIGQPYFADVYTTGTFPAAFGLSSLVSFTGNFNNQTTYQTGIIATDGKVVLQGSNALIGSNNISKRLRFDTIPGSALIGYDSIASSPVMNINIDIQQNTTGPTDYGIYYTQLYRPNNVLGGMSKFGETKNSIYVPTGSRLDITGLSGSQTVLIGGGDVYTQKSWFKHRIPESPQPGGGIGGTVFGTGGGIAFYSQNRVNTQMRNTDPSKTSVNYSYPYPTTPTASPGSMSGWLENAGPIAPILDYNQGYNYKDGVSVNVGYDVTTKYISDMPVRIYWSAMKPQDSLQDNYRDIQPLNFHDLNLSDGEIVHHMEVNGELLTWQNKQFQRQFFNNRGELQLKNDDQAIVIGDGSVMSRDGMTISNSGSKHKWSIIKGRTQGGNDVVYWINTQLKKVFRFGIDGTRCISDINNMKSFFANELHWVDLYSENAPIDFKKYYYDNPMSGYGISGVWDDRNNEVIWTVRGKNQIKFAQSPWYSGLTPSIGDVVSYTGFYYTHEQTGEFYKCVGIPVDPTIDPISSLDANGNHAWVRISHSDSNYYNEYTIAFNEEKNKFTTFYTFKPKLYMRWNNGFVTPDPIYDYLLYLHNDGTYCSWYDGYSQEDGYITVPYSKDENTIKLWMATMINCISNPYLVKFYTKNHESYLDSADFDIKLDQYSAAIKNDILTSSTGTNNDEDTSNLYGQYLLSKYYFPIGTFQKIVDWVIKYIPMKRNYRS